MAEPAPREQRQRAERLRARQLPLAEGAQLALDVVIALLLCMLVLRVSAATPLGIASTLATIQEEAAHVREFGPLLAVVGPPFNSLGIPSLGFEAPPLPPLPLP